MSSGGTESDEVYSIDNDNMQILLPGEEPQIVSDEVKRLVSPPVPGDEYAPLPGETERQRFDRLAAKYSKPGWEPAYVRKERERKAQPPPKRHVVIDVELPDA